MVERQSVMYRSAPEAMAFWGFRRECSQTVRSARVISAQSIGTTLRSGLTFHIWSMEPRSGSLAMMSLNCFTPPASILSMRSWGVTCHQGLSESIQSRAAPE